MSENTLRKLVDRSKKLARTARKAQLLLLAVSGLALVVNAIGTNRLIALERADYDDQDLSI